MQTIKWFIFTFSLVVFMCKADAQSIDGNILQFEKKSKVSGQAYKLFVSLPQNYSLSDTARYPVLYVLDGNFMFPVMKNMHRLLNEIQEVQDMIIVGVGYNTTSILGSTEFRTPDYTPTKDTAFENMLTKDLKMKVRTGGAELFLKALKQEIFPLIETQFRTSDRGLAGHSFGGLFGTYVLFHEPAVFSKYLLSSISLFWDKEVVLRQEEEFHKRGQTELPAHLFFTVGEQETFMGMIPLMQKLVATMREHQYKGLVIEERLLRNENHASAFLTAFNHGLRVLYKKEKRQAHQ